MTRMALTFFTFVFAIGAISCSRTRGETITQEELVRRTQEFLDAIPSGDRTPWKKYAIKVVTAEPDFGSHRNLELRLGRN